MCTSPFSFLASIVLFAKSVKNLSTCGLNMETPKYLSTGNMKGNKTENRNTHVHKIFLVQVPPTITTIIAAEIPAVQMSCISFPIYLKFNRWLRTGFRSALDIGKIRLCYIGTARSHSHPIKWLKVEGTRVLIY